MFKSTIRHEHLKVLLGEILELQEDTPDETFKKFEAELMYSSLIIAGDVSDKTIGIATISLEDETYGLLFTDMDEFGKVFKEYEVESNFYCFGMYLDMLKNTGLDGFIINLASECFILPEDGFEENEILPEYEYSTEDSYTSGELKMLKSQINNSSLEEFIGNPQNIGRYEELFDEVSASTILTLRLSEENLNDLADDGMISMERSEPLGFLYSDNMGGNYATVFTSDEKMKGIDTTMNKYSQIVNFSQMTSHVLTDDMDGIIINPESDNIVLTREMLLEFSQMWESKCNDPKLNSAIFHMFLIEA